MGRRRRRRKDDDFDLSDLPPWLQLVVICAVAVFLLFIFVPRVYIYIGLAIAILIIAAFFYFLHRKHGWGGFLMFGKDVGEIVKESNAEWSGEKEREAREARKTPSLSQSVKDRIIHERGDRCQNPNCRNTHSLQVHHIIPRAEGGPNKQKNLIVLCGTCHNQADKGEPSKERLRLWAKG